MLCFLFLHHLSPFSPIHHHRKREGEQKKRAVNKNNRNFPVKSFLFSRHIPLRHASGTEKGNLLFPVFQDLLSGKSQSGITERNTRSGQGGDLEILLRKRGQPRICFGGSDNPAAAASERSGFKEMESRLQQSSDERIGGTVGGKKSALFQTVFQRQNEIKCPEFGIGFRSESVQEDGVETGRTGGGNGFPGISP